MSIHLVTFASDDMSRSAYLCRSSAVVNGVDGGLFHYSPYDVMRLQCYEQNRTVFDAPRGCGYWSFKPALIDRLIARDCFIRNINDGDILIYSDVGVEFIADVHHIIDRMNQDVFLFGNMYQHVHWCKKDTIDYIWPRCTHGGRGCQCDWTESLARFGKQVQASVIFFRVNDKTRAFVAEWLKWCLFDGGRLIDDSPGWARNHPEFKEHRHDQSILTTLAYRDGYKLHWWPAQYNDGAFVYERGDYPDEGYPILFHHHRRRQEDWDAMGRAHG